MKHLKSFNEELTSDKYARTSTLLKKMGHTSRASKLEDWSKVVKEKEFKAKWEQKKDNFSIDGTFRLKFFDKDKMVIDEDFYLQLFFEDYISSDIWDEPPYGQIKGGLSFMIGVIPINEESYYKCKEILPSIDYYNGHFWGGYLSIPFKMVDDEIVPIKILIDEYDSEQSGIMKISDRKTSVKLKKILWEIFSGKEKYPGDTKDGTDCLTHIEKTFLNISNRLSVDTDSDNPSFTVNFKPGQKILFPEKIAEFIRTFSVNHLYQN